MIARPPAAALALALLAAPAARGDDAAVADLVKRCVAAYGGPAAVARAAVVRERGRTTSILHPGATGRLLRVYQRPGRLRVEIAFPGDRPEVRVLDGGRGWRWGEPSSGPQLVAMILQAARLDLPAMLQAWRARVTEHGTWQHDGKALRVLAVPVAPGVEVEAGIDPVTGRILRSRGSGQDPAFPLEFVTTYSDFRTVDGVLVAFREGNWANGAATGETVLERVEVQPQVDEGAFRP
ncbi:MAG TPA: hypothetical protein VLU43_11230 [Anaeromyxobacteraceae bacterium]|nr:hypothetical protein [Anaeromyxobacteraceae bacterium]